MAMAIKELCRLCAKKNDFSKDLLDESNRSLSKIIQEFIQIVINDNDKLPSRICLDCEEKMVSFQLFVLECYKVQETLKKMREESFDSSCIKVEIMPLETGVSIKSEVKDEVTAEDIVSALNNKTSVIEAYPVSDQTDIDEEDYVIHNDEEDSDDEYLDKIANTALKKIKIKHKKKEITQEDNEAFNQLLKRPNLKVKDFVKLQCPICNEILKSWSILHTHCLKEHKSEPYLYCICGFVIKSKSSLYKHTSDHKLESRKIRMESELEEENQDLQYSNVNVKDYIRFTCPKCSIECSSWYSLRAHCESVHKIRPVVLCKCGITLKSKSVMYKHVQDHRSPNVLACDKCPRITKSLTALNKHKLRHVPKSERKFICSACDKYFTTKDALKSHQRSHIPVEQRKIYHCETCNMKFTTRSSAASHKRVVHDKIKSYVCDLCGYACGTNGELRQHRAIHSDDKPFGCTSCNKRFKTYSNLKTHLDTHEQTSYECYICRRVLNSRRTLRKHLLVHEEKCKHVCSYCNKAFKRRQTLKVHMYTHTGDKPLNCKWCPERFSYASTLRSHRLRCHPDKMAQPHDEYADYTQHVAIQNEYNIRNDAAAIIAAVTKNETI